MDFNTTLNQDCKNCTLLVDNSFRETNGFMQKECRVDSVAFLSSKGYSFAATTQSLSELCYQPQQNSIGGFLAEDTSSRAKNNNYNNFVISKTWGVSLSSFDDGPILNIVSVNLQRPQTTSWESLPSFVQSSKSLADKSHIYYASENKNCWVGSNDKNQNQAITSTGGRFLTSVDLLVWMVSDNFINRQKAVGVFKKLKEKDPRWVPKETFAEYSRKAKRQFSLQ